MIFGFSAHHGVSDDGAAGVIDYFLSPQRGRGARQGHGRYAIRCRSCSLAIRCYSPNRSRRCHGRTDTGPPNIRRG